MTLMIIGKRNKSKNGLIVKVKSDDERRRKGFMRGCGCVHVCVQFQSFKVRTGLMFLYCYENEKEPNISMYDKV